MRSELPRRRRLMRPHVCSAKYLLSLFLVLAWVTPYFFCTSATLPDGEDKRKGRSMGMKAAKPIHSDAEKETAPSGAYVAQRQVAAPHPGERILNGAKEEATDATASNSIRAGRPALRQTNATVEEREFMKWCKSVLGIETELEIQTFEYLDYMGALPTDKDENDGKIRSHPSVDELPPIQVRGLAATRDITAGETVIKIPVQALLSVSTTIDQNPVLSRVMGPDARQRYQLTLEDTEDASYSIEMPLLAVALLHHRQLGADSYLYNYIRLLESTSTDKMPFLWSAERLKETSSGIREAAKGIRDEMHHMYKTIVQKLINEHPGVLGKKEGEPWMFSPENFYWAFAMMNSRHWELPMDELDSHDSPHAKAPKPAPVEEGDQQGLPPASTPTEEWVDREGDVDTLEEERSEPRSHAFMAPLADLLNFGPACTRGIHNKDDHTFEIVATCDFRKGQEVTFWYSDECDHVIVSAYGFTHPLVPACPSADEYRQLFEDWREKARNLELLVANTLDDLEHEQEVRKKLEAVLDGCDCCNDDSLTESRGHRLRHEAIRGSHQRQDEQASHGVRRSTRSRRSAKEL